MEIAFHANGSAHFHLKITRGRVPVPLNTPTTYDVEMQWEWKGRERGKANWATCPLAIHQYLQLVCYKINDNAHI